MRRNSKPIIFLLLLAIFISFASCNKNKLPIQEHMQYLTSEECMGRYPGTRGNENATEYISKKFEQYGLLPWKETYFSPSEITLRNTENLVDISLTRENKTITRFEYGEDFIQRLPQDCNLSLPVTNEPDGEDGILLLKNSNDMEQYSNLSYIKAFFIYENSLFKKNTNIEMDVNLTEKPYYIISDHMYKLMEENYGNIININSSYIEEKVIANNVIGKLEGRNRDTVLIVSAHLDHVGFIGDNIWYGAIDNASGVSSLLEIAKNFDKDSTPECDILFCAFNCEEAQLIGSKDIYELVKNDYKNIYNLNIDCIGGKEINEIVIDRNIDSDSIADLLYEKLYGHFYELGMESKLTTNTIPSDHNSFPNGICITTDTNNKYLHTTFDKLELIDMEYLNKITEAIQTILPELLKVITTSEIDSEAQLQKDISVIENKLNLGEYCYVTIDNDTRLIYNSTVSQTINEFEKNFIIDMDFANTIFDREYSLVNIRLGQNFHAAIEENYEKSIDKIYKEELNVSDLFNISFKKKEINANNPMVGIEFYIYNMQNEVDAENYEMMNENKSDDIFNMKDMSLSLVENKASNPGEEKLHNTLTTELKGEHTNIIVNLSFVKEFDLSKVEEYLQENNIEAFITRMGEEIFNSVGETKQ
jgi:hypothetical protein